MQNLTSDYYSTSYSSQGRTVDRVILSQSTNSLPATDSKQFYVATSRGREGISLFTDDKEGLKEAVGNMREELSATELLKEGEKYQKNLFEKDLLAKSTQKSAVSVQNLKDLFRSEKSVEAGAGDSGGKMVRASDVGRDSRGKIAPMDGVKTGAKLPVVVPTKFENKDELFHELVQNEKIVYTKKMPSNPTPNNPDLWDKLNNLKSITKEDTKPVVEAKNKPSVVPDSKPKPAMVVTAEQQDILDRWKKLEIKNKPIEKTEQEKQNIMDRWKNLPKPKEKSLEEQQDILARWDKVRAKTPTYQSQSEPQPAKDKGLEMEMD